MRSGNGQEDDYATEVNESKRMMNAGDGYREAKLWQG
jgi:hypothetical protein